MSLDIAAPQPSQAEINEWFELTQKLDVMKAREMELRRKIAKGFFPNPKEGTNNLPLSDGYVMKMGHVINRSLDMAQYETFRDTFEGAKIPLLDIIEMKPNLVLRVYRGLTAEQQQLFDNCLVIKDGSPSLDIVLPKRVLK